MLTRSRFCLLIFSAISLAVFPLGQPLSAADAAKPLKVCLISGSIEYKSNESLDAFQTFLESNYPVKCSRAFIVGEDINKLPGLENLDTCEVVLLFTRRLKISGDELEKLKNYCQSGRPLVGVRTASHALQNWLDLDKEVLGGNYHGHYSSDPETEIKIVESGKSHPVLSGFTPFRSAASLYKNEGLATDNELLLTGTIPEHTEAIAWTRMHKGGRVFYTSLGHPQDFTEASFRRLLVNALFWTAGRPIPIK